MVSEERKESERRKTKYESFCQKMLNFVLNHRMQLQSEANLKPSVSVIVILIYSLSLQLIVYRYTANAAILEG